MRSILRFLLLLVLIAFVIIGARETNGPPSVRRTTSSSKSAVSNIQTTQVTSPVATVEPEHVSSGREVPDVKIDGVATVLASAPSVGQRLLARGRFESFAFANNAPLAHVVDEQQPKVKLLCSMTEHEDVQALAIYQPGEIVRVSGEYTGSPIMAYPTTPTLGDCTMSGAGAAPQTFGPFVTVREIHAHGKFPANTRINIKARVRSANCNFSFGSQTCWLFLEDAQPDFQGMHLQVQIPNPEWAGVTSQYQVGDVAQLTCLFHGLITCKPLTREQNTN